MAYFYRWLRGHFCNCFFKFLVCEKNCGNVKNSVFLLKFLYSTSWRCKPIFFRAEICSDNGSFSDWISDGHESAEGVVLPFWLIAIFFLSNMGLKESTEPSTLQEVLFDKKAVVRVMYIIIFLMQFSFSGRNVQTWILSCQEFFICAFCLLTCLI